MSSNIAKDMRVGWVISHNGKRYSLMSITKVKPASAKKKRTPFAEKH